LDRPFFSLDFAGVGHSITTVVGGHGRGGARPRAPGGAAAGFGAPL